MIQNIIHRRPSPRHIADPVVAAINAAAAEAIVWALVDAGVREVVISPGSRNTPLILAIEAHGALATHVVLDERTAGFFALGRARISTGPVALVCTSGSAGLHYAPAIAEARHSRIPLIVLTADRPARLQNCGAPQTLDQHQLFGSLVRGSLQLEAPTHDLSPQHWYTRGLHLFANACSNPSGPVHANLRFDKPLWHKGPRPPFVPVRSPVVHKQAQSCDAASLGQLAERLATPRGVIVCGPLLGNAECSRADFAVAIENLASALGWPVVCEPLSGVAAVGHAIDHSDLMLRSKDIGSALVPECVLRFGAMPTSKSVCQWLDRFARGRTILVDSSAEWLDPTKGVDTLVIADPTTLCHQLIPRFPAGNVASTYLDHWRLLDREIKKIVDAHDCQWWEGAIVRTTTQSLPPGTVLHIGNSNAVRDLGSFSQRHCHDLRVLGSRGVNGIDGTVATALGEAWNIDGPAVLLCGDLTLRHDLASLLTSPTELATALTVVVVNNGGGGIFRQLPIAGHPEAFERYFLTPRPTVLDELCRAAGIAYRRVACASHLHTSLVEATSKHSSRGLTVIEVVVDGTSSETTRQRILARIHAALAHPQLVPTLFAEEQSS